MGGSWYKKKSSASDALRYMNGYNLRAELASTGRWLDLFEADDTDDDGEGTDFVFG